MKFTKEQQDFIKHCGEHFEVLTGGRSKTKEMIEDMQREIERLREHNIQLMKREELNCRIIKKYQNIIKEVREYIELGINLDGLGVARTKRKLLEILDKEKV